MIELALSPRYCPFLRMEIVDAVCLCSFCAVRVRKVFAEANTFVLVGEAAGRIKLDFENWFAPCYKFFLR